MMTDIVMSTEGSDEKSVDGFRGVSDSTRAHIDVVV